MYRQVEGLMMGASLSSAIAAIIINDTLIKVQNDIKASTLVVVYADDILMIGDPLDMGKIMCNFKHYLRQMPFTVEEETKNDGGIYSIQYLEMRIERKECYQKGFLLGSRLSTQWMKKVYDSGCTLNFISFHNWPTKRSIACEMFSKAVLLSSIPKADAALKQWFKLLTQNDYPGWVLVILAYDHLNKLKCGINEFKKLTKILGNVCKSLGFSKSIPNSVSMAFGDDSVGKSRKAAYMSFPLSADM